MRLICSLVTLPRFMDFRAEVMSIASRLVNERFLGGSISECDASASGNLHGAGRSVGEIYEVHRYLGGEAEDIERILPCRDYTGMVVLCNGFRYLFQCRVNDSESESIIYLGVAVDALCYTDNLPRLRQAQEGLPDGFGGCQACEVICKEDTASVECLYSGFYVAGYAGHGQ